METHTQFAAVFGRIERELGEGLRLDALAKIYGTSHDTFAKNFTTATGMSPKEYVTPTIRTVGQLPRLWSDLAGGLFEVERFAGDECLNKLAQ